MHGDQHSHTNKVNAFSEKFTATREGNLCRKGGEACSDDRAKVAGGWLSSGQHQHSDSHTSGGQTCPWVSGLEPDSLCLAVSGAGLPFLGIKDESNADAAALPRPRTAVGSGVLVRDSVGLTHGDWWLASRLALAPGLECSTLNKSPESR